MLDIPHKIYAIRGQKVMLDDDLAALYQVETRVLHQSIKRNQDNFPEDFMFQLTRKEWTLVKTQQADHLEISNSSQIVMSSNKHRGKTYIPYAFTEHGVAMLASVLKSSSARKMNIAIVRTFIALRKTIPRVQDIRQQMDVLKEGLGEHDNQLAQIYESLENLLDERADSRQWNERERIGFLPSPEAGDGRKE